MMFSALSFQENATAPLDIRILPPKSLAPLRTCTNWHIRRLRHSTTLFAPVHVHDSFIYPAVFGSNKSPKDNPISWTNKCIDLERLLVNCCQQCVFAANRRVWKLTSQYRASAANSFGIAPFQLINKCHQTVHTTWHQERFRAVHDVTASQQLVMTRCVYLFKCEVWHMLELDCMCLWRCNVRSDPWLPSHRVPRSEETCETSKCCWSPCRPRVPTNSWVWDHIVCWCFISLMISHDVPFGKAQPICQLLVITICDPSKSSKQIYNYRTSSNPLVASSEALEESLPEGLWASMDIFAWALGSIRLCLVKIQWVDCHTVNSVK